MVHEVETFVYRKEEGEPWHGLGESWTGYLSPMEVAKKAGVLWKVIKVPSFICVGEDQEVIYTGQDALVRDTDKYILDNVSQGWNDVDNLVAFEFFDEYCKEGSMHMSTAGSLQHGRIVFALAKINQGFELFKGKDKIEPYMLFTNPHKYGWSTSVSLTAIRVVCMNTLKLSLGSSTKEKIVRVSHNKVFNPEEVKETLELSRRKLEEYKERAEFLASRKAKKFDVVEYFKEIFPVLTKKDATKKELSKAAARCVENVDTQPGAEFAGGTWWNAYNALTFYTDHQAGRTSDSRVTAAWYGTTATLKTKALKRACELAQ